MTRRFATILALLPALLPALLLAGAAPWTAALADGGVKLRTFAGVYSDVKGAALKAPEGVTAAGDGIAVADTGNGRVLRFALAGERYEAAAEYVVPELPYPIRLAGTSKADLFVLDGRQRRIGRLGSAGTFKGFLDLPVGAVPRALTVDRSDALWVLDVGRRRVFSIGPDGTLAKEIALPSERGAFFSDVAVGANGSVFVLDSVGRRVLVAKAGTDAFAPFGETLEKELDFATSIAVDESGRVFVADQNGGGIVTLGPDGSFRGRQSAMGWKEGQLRYPSALALANGRLLVADRGNNRVQVFNVVQ